MIYSTEILIPTLCPIHFGEIEEVGFYPQQQAYIPKLNGDTPIQFRISDTYALSATKIYLKMFNKNGQVGSDIECIKNSISYFSYCECTTNIGSANDFVWFELWYASTILAVSLVYERNPAYTADLKRISYTNESNDFNVVFFNSTTTTFYIDIECGFIPDGFESKISTQDFQDQQFSNDQTYGMPYSERKLTIGDGIGIPTWMWDKLNSIFILSEISITDDNDVSNRYKRANGAKVDLKEATDMGLGVYEIALQKNELPFSQNSALNNDYWGETNPVAEQFWELESSTIIRPRLGRKIKIAIIDGLQAILDVFGIRIADTETRLDGLDMAIADTIRVDQTAPQTFENGIPKLASDRVISDSHELIDKAYADSIPSGGVKSQFFTKTASDVAGMYKAQSSYPTNTPQNITVAANTGETVIAEFIEDVHPTYRVLDGSRFFHILASVDNTAKPIQLKGYVYQCDVNGANPVLLRTSSLSSSLTTLSSEYVMSVWGNALEIPATVRIKFVIVAVKTISGGGVHNVTIAVDNDTFSRLDVPTLIQDISGKEDSSNKDASNGYSGLTLFAHNFWNSAKTFKTTLIGTATQARAISLPDKDGTVALASDITDLALGTASTHAAEDFQASEVGKGLSTNDYTDEDKATVDSITTGSWTGVRWNPKLGATTLTRVGDANWQQLFEDLSCVTLNDDGTENTVLATYSAPTITGATDGSIGQVMLKIPRKYYREIFNSDGELCGIDMSNLPLSGFKLHEKFSWGNGRSDIYIGAYEASLGSGKLQSISGVATQTSSTVRDFNNYALARGPGWHGYDYWSHHLLQMMFYVYYANLNSQLVLPAYSEHGWSDSFKRNTGRTNGLTTMNGYVNADESGIDSDLVGGWFGSSRVIGNRFLWVENFYGHIWKFLDGCIFDGRVGKKNTAFITPNPLLFSSVDSEILSKYMDMNCILPSTGNENWQASLGAAMLPKSFGGNSTMHVTDYFWSYLDDAGRDYLRVVLAGGSLSDGALDGVAAQSSSGGLGGAWSAVGSRLCFEKN